MFVTNLIVTDWQQQETNIKLLSFAVTAQWEYNFSAVALLQTKQADILVVGVGKPNMVKADWVKPGAVVIDCGITAVQGQYLRNMVAPQRDL